MSSVLANAAVQVWMTLLIFAPGIAYAVFRRPSAMVFAAGGAISLVLVSVVTFVIALAGYSPMVALRIIAVLLGLVTAGSLAVLVLRAVRQRSWRLPGAAEWAVIVIAVVLGIWVMGPACLALHSQGLRFGLVGLGNPDLPNYALAAQNIAQTGFHDSHHVANVDMGNLAHRQSYVGAIAVLNFIAAATPLSELQATTPAMGVAVTVMAVGLWSLGRAIWPESRRAVALAVTIACVSGLTVFNYGYYFLGAIFGISAVAMSVAGAIEISRRRSAASIALLVAGTAWGIYAYGFLQLPLLPVLPFVAVLAAVTMGTRGARTLGRLWAVVAVGMAAALLLASPSLPDVIHLLGEQGDVKAGFPLVPVTGLTATVWPQGIEKIGAPQHGMLAASWGAIVLLLIVGLVASWRAGRRSPAVLGALTLLATLGAVAVAIRVYGPTRYQTWKLQSFIGPLAVVAVVPAVASGRALARKIGTTGLAAVMGATLLAPWLLWDKTRNEPDGLRDKILPSAIVRLKSNPLLKDVTALNLRLPNYTDEMGAGAVLDSTAVVFTGKSYYPKLVSRTTCTLTMRYLLSASQRDFRSLGDGYVLLNRPSTCARKP